MAATAEGFEHWVRRLAEHVARDAATDRRLEAKRRERRCDDQLKPLIAYGREELARSHRCFFGRTAATTRRASGSSRRTAWRRT